MLSSININLLESHKDEYLLQKFNRLLTLQEKEREKQKEKEKTSHKKRKKSLTIITTPHLKPKSPAITEEIPKPSPIAINQSTIPLETTSMIHSGKSFLFLEPPSAGKDPNKNKNSVSIKKSKFNTKSLERINEIINRTQNKYKLKGITKESKFNDKIKDFKTLDTFVNVQSLLQSLNITNPGALKNRGSQMALLGLYYNGEKRVKNSIGLENDEILSEMTETNPGFSTEMLPLPKKLEKNIKLKQKIMTDEDVDRKIKFSTKVCTYLNEDVRRSVEEEFERNLLNDFEKNELKLIQQKNRYSQKYSMSQEMELKHLQGFVERQIHQNQLKKEIQNGQYFQKYREQTTKVLQILGKTTKKIYANKISKINENLINANKKFGGNVLNENQTKIISDFSNDLKAFKSKSLHKNSLFITDENTLNSKNPSKTARYPRSSTYGGDNFLPIITIPRKKLNIPLVENFRKKIILQNRFENDLMKEKMEDFIKNCDELKTNLINERPEDLKEIKMVQSTIHNGLEKFKGSPQLLESLRITLDKSKLFNPNRKKKRGSTLSLGSIVGII